ncbi:MAG TPA: peptidase E [Thermoanaerobaculia bacterium]|jgi:peptidase E
MDEISIAKLTELSNSGVIATLGGGGFLMEPRNRRLDNWLLSLTRKRRPRVLFLPTASGDAARYVARFHRAFPSGAHLGLFNRTVRDLRSFVLRHDVVYVGGGNTANMLAVWRVHGLDAILKEACDNGTLLCGVSAGANCWFENSLTDSFGRPLRPLDDGLGLLPGSFCPHYDGERDRRAAYRRFVANGALPEGWAAEDSVAVLWRGGQVAEIVASRRGKSAWRVSRDAEQRYSAAML